MVQPSSMAQVSIMIPGLTASIIRGPGPGVSICAIIRGPAGASGIPMGLAGSISVSAGVAMGDTGVVAAGAEVAGGVHISIVLPMYGIVTAATVIMAIIIIATGMST